MANDKIKVAIIGGGCGALTAAFELTRPQRKRGRKRKPEFEVTVYQMGWRLGGKGASGRNAQQNNRTEEHGLHVWMGFYENAFRLIRACYLELPKEHRRSRFKTWDDAFIADPWVGVANKTEGAWHVWSGYFPATPGLPGDPLDPESNPFALGHYLERSCELLRALIQSVFFKAEVPAGPASAEPLDFSSASPGAIVDKITSVLRNGVLTGLSALYEAMAVLKVVVSGRFSLPNGDYLVLQYVDAIARNVKQQADLLLSTNKEVRLKLDLIDLVITVIVGIVRDELLSDPQGLDAINDEDCRVWLLRHGASQRAVDSSLVRALYDMAFADHPDFGSKKPRGELAAGQAVRGALRMFFTYRGSLFWKLRAGMGDAIFSPLYEVLKYRGVKFEFFHELIDVVTSEAGEDEPPYVTQLKFRKQAQHKLPAVRDEHPLAKRAFADHEYYPLDADGCWPSQPDPAQVDTRQHIDFESPRPGDGQNERLLNVNHDFNFVVLGVSLGALRGACPSLLKADDRWRAMVDNVKTVATQALQLWTTDGLEALSPLSEPMTVSGFEPPFDTWSDMTHIVAEEKWGKDWPKGLAYFCGVLPDKTDPAEQVGPDWIDASYRQEIERGAVAHIEGSLPLIWPKLLDESTHRFRWSALFPSKAKSVIGDIPILEKVALMKGHYFGLNVKPSDRYVLSRPDTMQYRISPLDSGYDNLTIAGDWTDCGFNEGCVEAAVMSGLLACHALSGLPALEDIVGFDHP